MSKPFTALVVQHAAQQQYAIVDLERALIGALIQFSSDGLDAQKEAFEAIRPYSRADIYNENNRVIFSSVASMIEAGELCTAGLLHKRLADLNRINDVGGLGVIAGLCNDGWSYNTPDKIKALSKELVEESRKRKTYELETIVRQGLEVDGRTVDEVLSDVQARINSLTRSQSGTAFKLNTWKEIANPSPVNWLIRDVLESNNLACLYGASGCGKSFVAVDLSLCIASGNSWHGHKVKQGSVVYFAGEGKEGLRRRVAAWLQNKQGFTGFVNDHFLLAERACLLPDDTSDVIEALKSIKDLRLVVLDTINRTMIGDENSTRDMTAYIQACDKIKEAIPNLTILLIHHTGHSANDRARGSSALRASLDTEISANMIGGAQKTIVITSTKSKDSEPFKPINFRLESVELEGWHDDDGNSVSSACVQFVPEDEVPSQQGAKGVKLSSKNQSAALTILGALSKHSSNNLESGGYDTKQAAVLLNDWQAECLNQKLAEKPSKFKERLLLPLQNAGLITVSAPYVYLAEE